MMNCAFINNIKDLYGSASDNYVPLCDKHKNIRVSKSEQLARYRAPTCFEIFCLCNNRFIPHTSKVDKCNRTDNKKRRVSRSKFTNSVQRLTTSPGCVRSTPCFLEKGLLDDIHGTDCLKYGVESLNRPPFENIDFKDDDISLENLNHKSEQYMYEDTDVVPVKLKQQTRKSSTFTADEKRIKMSNARQHNFTSRSPDRKQNSWGRILKDQNVGKNETKKVANNASKTRYQTPAPARYVQQQQPPLVQQQQQQQEKNVVQQQSKSKQQKPVPVPVKEIYSVPLPVNTKSYSNHSLPSVEKRSSTSINSESTISGESIMLIDRSVQCSSTNLENPDNMYNFGEINQAGDNGLAFFNPVRTLNFLIRELRGKVSEGSEDENMARIIRDMENTVMRLSKTSPQCIKENLSALISEDDLKCVLEILQNTQKINKVTEPDKGTLDLQLKLEETCCKLEEMCRIMEKTANSKIKEEKQTLISEMCEKTEQLEAAENKARELEHVILDLKEKNEEGRKAIMTMRDIQLKYTTLNSVLNEQVQDAKRENERLHNEMKFLFLEKEKNSILMETKDEEIVKMRENLEEIKSMIAEQLNSFQVLANEKEDALQPEQDRNVQRQPEFDRLTTVSAISTVTWHNANIRQGGKSGNAPMCSSPATSTSPALEEDESWRRISKVSHDVHPIDAKAAGIKESLKNLFHEMKKQSKLNNNLSIQNLINLDEPGKALTNWSDQSDDDLNSVRMLSLSDTDTNFSK